MVQTINQKRNHQTLPLRRQRTRASKACSSCRTRKVRCDVSFSEPAPCTNCRLDKRSCVIALTKRNPKRAALTCTEFIKEDQNRINRERADDLRSLNDGRGCPNIERSNESSSPSSDGREDLLDNFEFNLPIFAKRIGSHLSEEDIIFLHRKDAFTIPSTGLVSLILGTYMNFIHPQLPLLDAQDLSSILDGHQDGPKLSLFLVHAVLLAGASFLRESLAREFGYPTSQRLQETIYGKLRALYNVEYEKDRITSIQALLLISISSYPVTDGKDASYWTGLALSLSYAERLNAASPVRETQLCRKAYLHRRIWWCCFMREHVLALDSLRPIRISDEDFDTRTLALGDCELRRDTAVKDGDSQKILELLFVYRVRLCFAIRLVLALRPPAWCHGSGSVDKTDQEHARLDAHILKRCEGELLKCQEDVVFVKEAWFARGSSNGATNACIATHVAAFELLLGTITAAVYRTCLSLPPNHLTSMNENGKLGNEWRVKGFQAATNITRTVHTLSDLELLNFAKTSAAQALFAALTVFFVHAPEEVFNGDICTPSSSSTLSSSATDESGYCQRRLGSLRENFGSGAEGDIFLTPLEMSTLLSASRQKYSGMHRELDDLWVESPDEIHDAMCRSILQEGRKDVDLAESMSRESLVQILLDFEL